MLAETMRSATRALTKERDDRQSTECRQREDDRLKTCGADSWLECPMRKNKFVHFSVSGVFVALANRGPGYGKRERVLPGFGV